MASGPFVALRIGNKVKAPSVVRRPTIAVALNQSAPSGPDVMLPGSGLTPAGTLVLGGMVYSVTAPEVVMRPILPESVSVNQRAPSGPAVMLKASKLGMAYSVSMPDVVMRPIPFLPLPSVNQRAPSGPAVIAH